MRELKPRGRQSRGTTRAHKLLVHVPAALCGCWDPSYWWTYQRHCGMLGPEILVDVPAALCERWAQGVSTQERAPPAGQPTRELVGRVTVFVSGNPVVFFNAAAALEQVTQELYLVSAFLVLPQACLTSTVPCSRSFLLSPYFFYSLSFSSLVAFRSSARSLPPIASGVSFTSAYLGRLFVDANMGRVSTSTTQTMARCVDARRR